MFAAPMFMTACSMKVKTCHFCVFNRYYRKTKLSGFQDMECILCGDPPPPYEPHCKHLSFTSWPNISGTFLFLNVPTVGDVLTMF